MKKVAIISRALYRNGATKALVEMLKRIDYSQIKLDLWILDFSNPAEEWVSQIPDNVVIKQIPRYNLSKNLFGTIVKHPYHFLKSLRAGYKLRTEEEMIDQWKYTAQRLPIINEDYDIAISFRHFDIDVFFVIDNINAKKKYFWIHGVQEIKPRQVQVLTPYYQKYNGVLPVSIAAKNNIEKFFPMLKGKCTVAYCIVDPLEIKKAAETAKQSFEQKVDEPIIFTIGRLGEEKGIDIAVEAAKILKDRSIKFKWYVAGEGNQRNKLEKMINEYALEDYFVLLGNVLNPYGMLSECDVYVQPSRLESYGLAINEAKIFQKAIVCSDIPAAREQIKPGETGILVELSGEKFANAIENIINNKDISDYLENNLNEDWGHFEVVKIFQQLINDEI